MFLHFSFGLPGPPIGVSKVPEILVNVSEGNPAVSVRPAGFPSPPCNGFGFYSSGFEKIDF